MRAQESFHSRRGEEYVATYTLGMSTYMRTYSDLFQYVSTWLIYFRLLSWGDSTTNI